MAKKFDMKIHNTLVAGKQNDDDDSDDDAGPNERTWKKYTKVLSSQHDLYFSDIVKYGSLQLADLFHDLNQIDGQDVVVLHLDSDGGNADMGFRIARALKQCKVPVLVRVEANCYSAGAIIALAGTHLTMQPSTFLMFHNYSGGVIGKGGEIKSRVENEDNSLWSQCKDIICPFLTQKEIRVLQLDQDIYIHAPSEKTFSKAERARNKKLKESLLQRCKRHFPLMKDYK